TRRATLRRGRDTTRQSGAHDGAWSSSYPLLDKFVEHVPPAGLEAGLGDDAAELVVGGAESGAGGGDDVFFDHEAAQVVGAESQGELADAQPLRDPTGLEVGEVVEEQPAYGEHLEVAVGADFGDARQVGIG